MPKLREAALVATMVGSVSMLGAGVAFAGGGEEAPRDVKITCNQSNGDTAGSTDLGGLVTITGPLITLADSRNMQNICGVGNTDNDQTSGDANGGVSSLVE